MLKHQLMHVDDNRGNYAPNDDETEQSGDFRGMTTPGNVLVDDDEHPDSINDGCLALSVVRLAANAGP